MMSVYSLEGHSKVATDLVFSPKSNELISVSHERIAFWDLNSGELSRSIYVEDVYPGRKKLFLSDDGRYLVVDCDILEAPVHIYDMKTLQLLYSCGARLATQRRAFISGSLLCRQKHFIDITKGSLVKTVDDFMTSKTYVMCALSSDNRLILVGDETETKLLEFASGKVLASLPGPNSPSAMAITSDSKRAYIGYAESCEVRIFNIDEASTNIGRLQNEFDPKTELRGAMSNEYIAFKGNEVSEISVSPTDQNIILLNINRSHLLCLNTVTLSCTNMNTQLLSGRIGRVYIFCSMFSGNGQFVLSSVENYLDIWRPEDGELVHTITLHTTPPYPIAVWKNLVATASTVNTFVRVWDLDNIQESKTPKIHVYEAPVDCVACADQNRLVFVKSQVSLSSMKGFKFMDYFGIDVWNVATGTCQKYLTFGRYGRLLQMEVSTDGRYISLLLNAVDDWYIAVIDLDLSGSVRILKHKKCVGFVITNSWEFLASFARGENLNQVKLWDGQKEKEVLCIDDAVCPVFTHDSLHLLYIDLGKPSSNSLRSILVYSLQSYGPVCTIPCQADSLLPLPVPHHLFIATKFASEDPNKDAESFLWTFVRKPQRPEIVYHNVGSKGILDVSKDGSFGVDGQLKVFHIKNGKVRCCFQQGKEFNVVRMTYDGLYVMWVDDSSVKVGNVASGDIIGSANAHERLTCLHTMDYGYLIVAGGSDGHLLTMKLAVQDEEGKGVVVYRAQNTEDRRNFLMDTSPCKESSIAKMDRHFQVQPKFLNSDRELPRASKDIQEDLLDRANVPLTVISTSRQESPADGVEVSDKRRSSTPINLNHITNVIQKSAILAMFPAEDGDSPMLPKLSGCSSSTHNLSTSPFGTLKFSLSPNKLMQTRSKSAQDLPRLVKLSRVPAIRGIKKSRNSLEGSNRKDQRSSREKMNLLHVRDEYRVDRAIESASSVIMGCFKIAAKDKPKKTNKTNGTKQRGLKTKEYVTSM